MSTTVIPLADVATRDLELTVHEPAEGASAVDIRRLLPDRNLITYDPGLGSTGWCRSKITYIDGDAGVLRYRGYDIADLATQASFLEVAYLLISGNLPTERELEGFAESVRRHTLLHEDLTRFFDGFPRDAHPMPVLSSAVSALSTLYQESGDASNDSDATLSAVRLLAKLPTIAAYAYKKSIGQPFIYPDNSLSYVDNFLRMTFGLPAEPYSVDPSIARALELLLILHADHEQNCSTSTVRLVGSAGASLYASVSAGVQALSGPLHGGANQAVLEMLDRIRSSGGDVQKFVQDVKNRGSGARLMGFGHRVYKNYDPRAAIVKQVAHDLLERLGCKDELLRLALELEEVALADDYFVERRLYPNVDFYTGLLYRAMGFPARMFTVLFAIGRLPGWIAQWHEMIADPDTRLGRPRQLYEGPGARPYPPRASRT